MERLQTGRAEISSVPRRRGRGEDTGPATGADPARADGQRAWATQVERFLAWKRVEAPVGEAWLRRMRWELCRVPRLEGALAGRTVSRPEDLGQDYLQSLRDRSGWERSTLALHHAALRQFLGWAGCPLARSRHLWRLPAGQPSRRRWLTREQLLRLLRRSRGLPRLLVALEALNGLRRVEVLRLRAQDILVGEGCVRVLGKGRDGGKWRKIPLHPLVARLLRPRTLGLAPADRLFPYSRSGADYLLRKAVVASGLARSGVKVSHHDLRRTFGRLSHEAGMDLVQLKNLFGHASMEMTVHYIGLDAEAMRSGLTKLSRHLGLERSSGSRR